VFARSKKMGGMFIPPPPSKQIQDVEKEVTVGSERQPMDLSEFPTGRGHNCKKHWLCSHKPATFSAQSPEG